MLGKTNAAGSGTKLFAAIGVTYPEGSMLTCTNWAKTLTAKTTTGQWVFAIPEAGTWTVTATDGTSVKSQSVSITSEGQLETISLAFELVLFDAANGGLIVPWEEGEMSGSATATITDELLSAYNGSATARAHIITSSKIDITGYSVLKFNITRSDGGTNAIGTCTTIDPFSKYGANNSAVHYVSPPVVGENSIPLTDDGTPATSGSYYIFLSANGSAVRRLSADRVWLE